MRILEGRRSGPKRLINAGGNELSLLNAGRPSNPNQPVCLLSVRFRSLDRVERAGTKACQGWEHRANPARLVAVPVATAVQRIGLVREMPDVEFLWEVQPAVSVPRVTPIPTVPSRLQPRRACQRGPG